MHHRIVSRVSHVLRVSHLVCNNLRFINHATGDAANMRACIVHHNGVRRVAIYTRKAIAVGKEMLLDYSGEL